ncbi:MAG: SLC26A/SulP transporter family protein [Burkholderiales bacterium]|nr:SLC26A/SulP transporter family protein [Burkholderiales bacterium]
MDDAATPAAGPTGRLPPTLRSAVAGGVGALATLAVVITLGLLGFAPMGPLAAAIGVPGAFAAAVVGCVVLGLASRCSVPIASPSSTTALVLAALVARLAQDPQVVAAAASAQPLDAARWVGAAAACAVVGMGLVQVALAACRLARLVHFVPQPVLAGFLNGVALLIVLAQVPLLLGAPTGAPLGAWLAASAARDGAAAWAPPLALGLATAAFIAFVAWRRPRWPALLAGFVFGLALTQAMRLAWPSLHWGVTVSAIPVAMPPGAAWLPFFDDDSWVVVARHAPAIGLTALLLGLIGALESLLSMVSIEQGSGRRLAPDRELAVLGLANVAGGLVGALPTVMLRAGALAVQRAGGRGAVAALAAAGATLAIFMLAGPALDLVPQALLAGVMLMVGFSLVDRWSARVGARWWRAVQRGRLPEGDDTAVGLAVMAVVCALTATFGVPVGVGVGVVLSLVVFVRRINRSLVRAQFTGTARPSRRIYPGAIEARLLGLRTRVALLELEGALFFGSAAHLPERAEALAPPVRFVILDLRRVSTVDESGAMLMHEVAQRLARHGQELLLAGVASGSTVARALKAFAPWAAGSAPRTFFDADQAMEAAEAALLAEAAQDDAALAALLATEAELPLEACSLVRGLSPRELRQVAAAMHRRELRAGDVIFRQGDDAEALYVVTRGSVSAVVVVRGTVNRTQRFASLGPGTMFGEMALLDQAGRSADAVADSDACLQVLSREGLDQLLREHPELAAKLYRNIAAHLGERLRAASIAWQAAAA